MVDVEALDHRYDLNGTEVIQMPTQKAFTLLHAMRKNEQNYIFNIGDRDGGYLKYGSKKVGEY